MVSLSFIYLLVYLMTLFRIPVSTAWNVSTVANNDLERAVKYFFPNLACVSECTVSNVVLEKDRKVYTTIVSGSITERRGEKEYDIYSK
jgi:branched-subunit amino acid aminotransferase/4-amino-4-deoxychorismate lyase